MPNRKNSWLCKQKNLKELVMKIEDVENLIDEVSDVAYDKAVEVVYCYCQKRNPLGRYPIGRRIEKLGALSGTKSL